MKIIWMLIAGAVWALSPQNSQANELYTGCKQGDCRNGYGVFVFKSGAKYMGNWQNGSMHGKGILQFSDGRKYTGEWINNQREGNGQLAFPNGDTYRGEFHQSKIHGDGTMQYANGDEYEGEWIAGKRQGEGVHAFQDGRQYEGAFHDGKIEGDGVMFFPDGSKFVGNWKNGKEHGRGTLYTATGQTEIGDWVNGNRIEEEIEEEWIAATDDTIMEAFSRNCNDEYCATGKGTYVYGDGSRYVGNFKEGEPGGEGTVYYANGDKYVGGWHEHTPHGEGVMYYASGKVVGAVWDYGKPERFLEGEDSALADTQIDIDEDAQVKVWAVVVGVARYAHMPALKYTDDDAYQIYAFLKSPEGGALPDDQIRVLIDENATRQNILESIRKIMLKADDNDVVLFYFSGHGLEGSFLPVDYDGYNNRVAHEDIKALLEKSQAKHKIVIADACHSGSLLAMKQPLHQLVTKYYAAFENSTGGTALMMSSKGEEYSLEDGGLRSGIFSYYLIRGLKGMADKDQNKIVTIQELFDYVYQNVRTYTGNLQTPTLTGKYDRGMPIAVIR